MGRGFSRWVGSLSNMALIPASELKVLPVPKGDRIVDHFEIGSDAMAFHRPRAIGFVDTKRGHGHRGSHRAGGAPGNADQTTPGSGPNGGQDQLVGTARNMSPPEPARPLINMHLGPK